MPQTPLISPEELAALLRNAAGVVVVDCRHDLMRKDWGLDQYLAGHIPGAVRGDIDTDLSSAITPETGRHPLPDPSVFAAWLAARGIGRDTSVVAYDQDSGAFAARLWWLLRALGHEAVAVLDGGFAAWTRAGLPLEAGPAARVARRAEGSPHAARAFADVVETPAVRTALAGGAALLVDARPADRFAGQNEVIDPVAGHVPGAVNHPFVQNLRDGRFLPPAELRARWLAFLDGRAPRDMIAMCGSGVTACHNLLAMHAADLPGARLYAGSFSEWIRDPARPVATGAAP